LNHLEQKRTAKGSASRLLKSESVEEEEEEEKEEETDSDNE
jgi:hypothetical protein